MVGNRYRGDIFNVRPDLLVDDSESGCSRSRVEPCLLIIPEPWTLRGLNSTVQVRSVLQCHRTSCVGLVPKKEDSPCLTPAIAVR